jgi:para-nitrobenzyl esterase
MKPCLVWCALLLAACGASAPPTYISAADTVAVSGGTLRAAADSSLGLRMFRGIPYAAPPVGALRWKAPQPVQAWSGVRAGDAFGNACIAGNRPFGQPGSILYQNTETQSEDCLFLNVWSAATPGSPARLPVMVLIHGGALLLGSGAQPNYDGSGLAGKGAVVVTFNYRLGPLGFLAHPALSAESPWHVSGNYGLQDALAALRWVAANIGRFGGDPSNVTLYSESAGAQLASALMVTPAASGLFQRAVLESLASFPAGSDLPTLATAEAAGTGFAANAGAADLNALRALSGQQIMAGSGALTAVVVDGQVLPDQPDRLYARGAFHDVPLLIGWNADEGTPYTPFASTLDAYRVSAASRYGSYASAFAQVYPVSSDADVQAMAYAPMRDGTFAWQPWAQARAHAAHARSPTWLYHFSRRPTYLAGQHFRELDPPERYGAHHTLEQVYFYNNLDRSVPQRAWTATDRELAAAASTYLLNFARTGNPNTGASESGQVPLPQWPVFSGRGAQALHLGDTIVAGPVPNLPALDFYDAFYTYSLGRALPFPTP